MDGKRDIIKRVYIVYLLIAAFAVAIIFKVVTIQYVEGDKWRAEAEQTRTLVQEIDAVRGNIYAADGSMLATSIPIYEVYWDPNADGISDEVFDTLVDSLAGHLSLMFPDRSASTWSDKMKTARDQGKRYFPIARRVRFTELKQLKEFPIFSRGRYKGGFCYQQTTKRERPFQMLAARTIGYEREGIKPVGLEGAYSEDLGGVKGKRLMQKLGNGILMPLNDANEVEPVDGSHIYTTIDINIQDVAEKALLDQLTLHDAHHGCVVLMEVATGEVKAIANLSKGNDGGYYEYYNYAIGESEVPGSTFKLATYIAALEDGVFDIDDTIDCGNGRVEFYDEAVIDTKREGYGRVPAWKAFAVSSNIGIARQINDYYKGDPQAFVDRLHKMHLSRPLGIEIFGEGSPLIRNAGDEGWSGISLPWMSFGYEVEMTPLQILTLYNAVANDGRMVKPKFVREVWEKGKLKRSVPTEVLNPSICSQKTLEKAHKMLEAVVEEGTATNLKAAHYKIAGKTGTAQIANRETGFADRSRISHQASFAGYFPAEDPKYSCIVVVSAPNKSWIYGSQVAGPVFKEIADKVYASSIQFHDELQADQFASLNRTRIPVSKNGYGEDLRRVFGELDVPVLSDEVGLEWVETRTGMETVELGERKLVDGLVPNVVGMSAQDAVFLLENNGLRVELKGRGSIKAQSLPVGGQITPGDVITLELG